MAWAGTGLILALGVALVAYGALTLSKGQATIHWHTTTGTVLASQVPKPPVINIKPQSLMARFRSGYVQYEYAVDGTTYTNWAVTFSSSTPRVGIALPRYPVGARVMVYYDPVEPQNSLLEPSPFPSLLPTASLLLGVLSLALGYWGMKRSARSR